MKRRDFIQRAGLGAAAVTLGGMGCLRTGSRPNIVIILTDDQGYADTGKFGAQGFSTPNLDRLADEGMRFTSFYASQAVCSASRASLLTGCYSERVSISGALPAWSEIGLHPEEETIADLLKHRGYATGAFGKWHLGHHPEFLPRAQGFDEYFGLPYSNDMWPVEYNGVPAENNWRAGYPVLHLIEGTEQVEPVLTMEDQNRLTVRYTERAVNFIGKHSREPFLLYLAHSMPHVPLAVSDTFRGKSEQGPYGDVIMEIDWSVGRVMDALQRHGLEENTLVIFASDNGPWLNFGKHAGSALPLREGKGTMFEGGPRVPCIMRWPRTIAAGGVCDRIAASIDILPTIAAVTGCPLPRKKIDGVSILPLLKGVKGAEPRDHYFYYYGGGLRAVRQGRWKLYVPHRSRSYRGVEPGTGGMPGPYANIDVGLELYDLEADISETRNVAAEHPDTVRRLQQLAETIREQLGDNLTNRTGSEVRPHGSRGEERAKRRRHKAVGASLSLTVPPSSTYPAKNRDPLIDGYTGSMDYHDGYWQGFEGDDLEAVIDLGSLRDIRSIACSFLDMQISWIFLPARVSMSISPDGRRYREVKTFSEKTAAHYKTGIKTFDSGPVNEKARYIKVRAENIAICPDWHEGAGGKAWIFADEIVVR
ncbi:sulfatase [bacterium]|nr:sulfatase [bacterium]